MALSDLDVKQAYNANGSTVDFAITPTLLVSDSAEVVVYTRDESTVPATEELQVEGALQDYTLTGAVPPGTPFDNNVRFNSAPASGLKVVIKRVMPLTQTLALSLGSALNQTSLELALDRLVAMIQQLDEELSRCAKLAVTEQVALEPTLPEPVSGFIIGWNAAGTDLEAYDPDDLTTSISGLAAHIADEVDAHDASAISNVPSGNLAATTVQAALDELQANIDILSPVTPETQMTLANNQAAADVTGLVFLEASYRAVAIDYTIERRTATQGYRQMGTVYLSYEALAAAWSIEDVVAAGSSGLDTGVTFTVTAGGQLQYATDNMAGGTYVGKMRHVVRQRFAKET